jgi:hypothetical protein
MKRIIYFYLTFLASYAYSQSTTMYPNRLDFAQRTYSQILAITGMQKGSTCYDTDNNCLRVYDGATWVCTKTTSAGFDDATGCCSGAIKVSSVGGISGPAVTFIGSTAYNNEFYEVGTSTYGSGIAYSYSFGAGGFSTFGNSVGWVSKYDQVGTNLWVTGFGNSGSPTNYNSIVSVKTDASGVYVIGTFNNSFTVASLSVTLTSAGGYDMYVAKLDPSTGAVNWIKQFGGTGDDTAVDLVLGETGNLYFTGYVGTGMTIGYCVPSTGSRDVFIGKLDKSTGNSLTNGGIINEPIGNSETVSSIIFYDNKVILVGSFQGNTVNAAYVMTGCAGILGGATLAPTFGREIYIFGYDTALLPINTYKLAIFGDSAGDNLNPFKATTENGFSGGSYVTKLKIAGNPLGTFPLGGHTINGGSYILTLNLAGSTVPSLTEVIDMQGTSITGFGDGYAVGRCNVLTCTANSGSASFGGQVGKNFMLSTSLGGQFKWVITSSLIQPPSVPSITSNQSCTTVVKVCGNVYGAGVYQGGIQLCSTNLDSGLRHHGYFWKYSDCGGCCN